MNNQLNWKLLGLAGMMMLWPLFSSAQVNLDSGLVVFYRCNELVSNDLSGSGHNGMNTDLGRVRDRFNRPVEAYSFNGETSRIEISHDQDFDFGIGDFAISLWKLHQFRAPQGFGFTPSLIQKYNTGMGWELSFGSPTTVGFSLNGGTDDVFLNYDTGIDGWTDSVWHHIVIRRRADELTLFFDGMLAKNMVIPLFVVDNTSSIVLGGEIDPQLSDVTRYSRKYKGLLDDLRIYNRALTDTEVQHLYTQAATSLPSYSGYSLLLSPNPAPGTFTLRSPQAAIQSLALYDLTGRRLPAEISHDRHQAEVRSSYRGLALVKVQTNQGMWIQKVLLE